MAQISAENIQGLEKRFVSAWTGAGSTPFIVDVVLSDVDLELATKVVQSFPISRIFELCPTVACWGTLKGLSDSLMAVIATSMNPYQISWRSP